LREINYLSIGENREKIIRVGFCKGKYHINNSNQTLYRKAKYE